MKLLKVLEEHDNPVNDKNKVNPRITYQVISRFDHQVEQ